MLETAFVCAFPTCRQRPVDMAHIVDEKDGGATSFENMIVLCANHHAMHTRREITTRELKVLKDQLALLNGRYSDLERRCVEYFVEHPMMNAVSLPPYIDLLMMHLEKDGLIETVTQRHATSDAQGLWSFPHKVVWKLTPKGAAFVAARRDGKTFPT